MTVKAPKTFPVYVSNGSVTVSIIQTKNGKYLNYRLRWKEAGGEKKENFADYGKAYERAETVAKNIAEGRVDLTGVKVSDMELIADLKKQIQPTGLTLSQVVQRFMDAWEPDIKETEVKIAYERYAEDKKKKGKFHQKDIRLIVGGLSAKFEKRLLSSLKREEVVSYVSKGYDNGRTINNRLNTVRGFFNWAKENQLISERNPHILEKVKTWDEERPDNYEESLMSAEDLKRLMVEICLKRDDEDELLIAVALMAFGGVRVNEFKRLKWENVKFDKGKLHAIQINAKEAKNPQRRTIELTDSLRNIIETVKRKESGPLTSYSSPERIIQKIAKSIGIRWHENTLRHTFLTHRLETTGDIARVSLSAGNSPQMIQNNYKGLTTPTEAKAWFDVAFSYRLAVRYQQLKGKPVPEATPEQLENEAGGVKDAPASIDAEFDPALKEEL